MEATAETGRQPRFLSKWGAPPLHPLVQLQARIKESQYVLTRQEAAILEECRYNLAAALVTGYAYGSLYGLIAVMGTGIPRIFQLGVVLGGGAVVGLTDANMARRKCALRILREDGSPLKGELWHILKEDFPRHPAVIAYERDHQDKQKDGPSQIGEEEEIALPRLPPKRDILSLPDDAVWGQDNDKHSGAQAGVPRIPQRDQHANQERQLRKVEDDAISDPFTFLSYGKDDADNEKQNGTSARTTQQGQLMGKRRSRMSETERREYNRQQGLEWERRHGTDWSEDTGR